MKYHYDECPRWGKLVNEAKRERVEGTLRLVPSVRTVLDLGCGDGMVSSGILAKGMDVTGVDLSRVAIKHFEGKKVVANMADLPFPDRSFDLILCAEVLEHLPGATFEEALEEIERGAARYVVISTPNEEYLPAGLPD